MYKKLAKVLLFARPLGEAGKAKWIASGGQVRAVQRKRDGATIFYRVLKEGTKAHARYGRQLSKIEEMRQVRKKQPKAKAKKPKAKPAKAKGKKILEKLAEIPPQEVQVDPRRFQFKIIGAETKTGEVGSLGGVGVWDDNLSGIVQVWRDPGDGKTYVVNGHNRLALAKKQGVQEIAVRYLAAKDAKEARAIGAKNTKGELSDMINSAASDIQQGGNKRSAEAALYKQVLENLEKWGGVKFQDDRFWNFTQKDRRIIS